MAKGEQRSNREKKKPKKEQIKTIATAPSQKGSATGWQPTIRVGQKEIGRAARLGEPFLSYAQGEGHHSAVKGYCWRNRSSKFHSPTVSAAPDEATVERGPKSIERQLELGRQQGEPIQPKARSKSRQIPDPTGLERDLTGKREQQGFVHELAFGPSPLDPVPFKAFCAGGHFGV
jgi:hypothetical protein